MKSRLLCIILTVLMILSLVACTDGTDDQGDQTVLPDAGLTLVENGVSNYVICRSESLLSSNVVVAACRNLLNAISKETKAELTITNDWVRPGSTEPEFEILVGNTVRDETKSATANLKSDNYIIKAVGKKLVIAGGSEDATFNAVQYFINNVVRNIPEGSNNLSVNSDYEYLYKSNYHIDSLSILGVPIEDYSIVIPSKYLISDYRTAVYLREHLKRNCGTELEIIYDNQTAEHEIRIGATSRSGAMPGGHRYTISASGGALQLSASSMYAYIALKNYVTEFLFDSSKSEISIEDGYSFEHDVTSTLANGAENVLARSGEYRVMFNNIYGNCQEIHPRVQRQQMLYELYMQYMPDVLGLQEYNQNSIGGTYGMDTLLKSLGYESATSTSLHNFTPLFYNPQVLTLLDSGFKRFSDGKGDASKSYTWGVFEVKTTGERYAVISTHFWFKNDDATDNAARLTDAEQLLAVVTSIENKYNVPVICGGDFNCNKTSEPYNKIVQAGCIDACLNATKTENMKSNHSYSAYNTDFGLYTTPASISNDTKTKSIDHILIKNGDKLRINLFDTVTDLYSLLSTDHCPIYIDFDVK